MTTTYAVACSTCGAGPDRLCTAPTSTGRRNVMYRHADRVAGDQTVLTFTRDDRVALEFMASRRGRGHARDVVEAAALALGRGQSVVVVIS